MYTDDALKETRLKYLRDCKRPELRRLRKEKKLDSHLQRLADRSRSRVDSLVQSEVADVRAWQWAIREVLLETEPD